MNKQRGSAMVFALVALGIIVAIIGVVVMSYISAYNTGNRLEVTLKAEYKDLENVYAQYTQKVLEVAQVPTMMKDDVKEVIREAISGRYGAEGSKAVFQAISEQNPTIDAGLYRKVQQVIEAGRDEFKTKQKRVIDQKATYEIALGSFWQGMWLRIAGYPKMNLDDIKLITTDRAEQVFKTGKEAAPLQLRPQGAEASDKPARP